MITFVTIILCSYFCLTNGSSIYLRHSRKIGLTDSFLGSVGEYNGRDSQTDDEEKIMKEKGPKLMLSRRSLKLKESYGSDINGSSNHGWLGASLSLSSTGETLAVGGYSNVLLFNFVSGDWRLENDFTSSVSTLGGYFNVGLSNDGAHLAVGAPNNDKMGLNSGRVFVFKKQSASWRPYGKELYGQAGDMFGCSVSFSANGVIIAVGSYGGGYVRMYKYSSARNVYGPQRKVVGNVEDGFGLSISLSGDGGVLAAGAPFYQNSIGSFRVSDVNDDLFAKTFFGNAADEYFGLSVAVSLDGKIVCSGTYGGNYVRTYEYLRSNFQWKQLGVDILGSPDAFGGAVAISGDGGLIAVGAPLNSRYGPQAGRVKTYKLVEGKWLKVDLTVYGSSPYDLCGASVAMSSDGQIAALGCPGKDDGGYDTGQIQAYEIPSSTSSGEDLDNDDGVTFEDDQIGSGDTVDWESFGEDIDGTLDSGETGQSLSLTSDAKMIIIGGRVRAILYTYQSGGWQLSYDFSDHLDTGYGFYRVTISNDGTHIAVGAPNNDVRGKDSGEVRTFENRSGSWYEIGKRLNGVQGNLFGCEISFSEDGKILAVGAYGGGFVRILHFKASTKTYEISRTLPGNSPEGFGFSVDLSGDGNTCVVGVPFSSDNKGFIRIYDVENDDFAKTFTGTARNDLFGFSVSISLDGMRVASGGHGGNYVRVFEHDGLYAWSQLGIDMMGYSDAFGTSVSLGEDGNMVAVGAPLNAYYGPQSGRTYIFERKNNKWEKVGSNLYGEASGDSCGEAVSLSSNGQKVATGCPLKSFELWQSGQVQVYKIPGFANNDDTDNNDESADENNDDTSNNDENDESADENNDDTSNNDENDESADENNDDTSNNDANDESADENNDDTSNNDANDESVDNNNDNIFDNNDNSSNDSSDDKSNDDNSEDDDRSNNNDNDGGLDSNFKDDYTNDLLNYDGSLIFDETPAEVICRMFSVARKNDVSGFLAKLWT